MNKFGGGLDRTNSSHTDVKSTKNDAEPPLKKKETMPKRMSTGSANQKAIPNTSRFGARKDQADKKLDAVDKKDSQSSNNSKFQSSTQGKRTSQGLRTVENQFIDKSPSLEGQEKKPLGMPFKKRMSRQSDGKPSLSMNQSQKDSDSRNMMDMDQPSGSENNVPDVVVEHIENLDQISIPEKEEEHIKSLAEVLFSDEMQEEEE